MYLFPRGFDFSERLARNVENLWEARAFDFPFGRAYPENQIGELAHWILRTYDSLRTRLVFTPHGVKACDSGRDDVTLESTSVEDILKIPTAESGLSEYAIDLMEGPVCRFVYYSCAAQDRSLLRIVCSHLAVDLVTFRVIERGIDGYWQGQMAVGSVSTYLEWMQAYGNHAGSPAGKRELRYWQSLPLSPFQQVKQLWRPETGQPARTETISINPSFTFHLRSRVKERGLGEFISVLAGCLLVALSDVFHLKEIPLQWTAHGRFPLMGGYFSRTSGWLSSEHPLLVSLQGDTGAEAADRFRKATEGIPHQGASFRWVTRLSGAAEGAYWEDALWSPFTINLRSNSKVRINSEPGSVYQGPAAVYSSRVQPDWNSPRRFYILIEFGLSLQVSITSLPLVGRGHLAQQVLQRFEEELLRVCARSIVRREQLQ